MACLIPGSHLEIVPGVGHMLPYEEPELVTRFVTQALAGARG